MAAACSALPAHAGPADRLMQLAKGFEDAALRLDDDSAEAGEIVRWDGPIVMAFVKPGLAPRQAELMRKAVREIALVAGVTVREVEASDPAANFVGRYSDSASAGAGGGRNNCFSSSTWKDGRLRRVDLNFGARLGLGGDRCVEHEVVHGFGLTAHPHGLDSILSYVYNREGVTSTDRLLIETLYERRLRPGMPRAVAAPIACRILADKTGVSARMAEPICALRGIVAPPTLVRFSHDGSRP